MLTQYQTEDLKQVLRIIDTIRMDIFHDLQQSDEDMEDDLLEVQEYLEDFIKEYELTNLVED